MRLSTLLISHHPYSVTAIYDYIYMRNERPMQTQCGHVLMIWSFMLHTAMHAAMHTALATTGVMAIRP